MTYNFLPSVSKRTKAKRQSMRNKPTHKRSLTTQVSASKSKFSTKQLNPEAYEPKLRDAIIKGNISYKELEGIIKRFQDYETRVLEDDDSKILLDDRNEQESIKQRSICVPKLGESVNKMRKIMPLERSESNNMLKLIKLKKKADEFERSRVNLTQIFEPHDRMSLNQSVTRF